VTKALFVVFTNPSDDAREDAYNDWYTNRHVLDVLTILGFIAATRYRIADFQREGKPPAPFKYMALYEVDEEDLSEADKTLAERANTELMALSDALGGPRQGYYFVQITELVVSDQGND